MAIPLSPQPDTAIGYILPQVARAQAEFLSDRSDRTSGNLHFLRNERWVAGGLMLFAGKWKESTIYAAVSEFEQAEVWHSAVPLKS